MVSSLPLSIVVPSRNTVSTLRAVLAAIRASDLPKDQYELIVVDDASQDASPTVAARYADTVIRLRGIPLGRPYACNRGAELAKGEIVAFVDPEVLVRQDTLRRMVSIFAEQPSIDAISASHDDAPAAQNFVSQYWNLLLHFGDQRYAGPGGDVGSGCSAVRRSVLMRTGMYDEWRFDTGSLEGLELGQRLESQGSKVVVSRTLQVTHLKRWGVVSVAREVWNRSRLLARSLGYQRTRVSVPSEVVFTLSRAMPSALAVVSIVALSGAFLPEPWLLTKAGIALSGVLAANMRVHRFYARTRGLAFAVGAIPMHLFAQGVAAVALCVGWILRDTVGDRSPDATTQAYAEVGLETWPPVPRRR
jgi:glycosyltransferase involved in cell wall biosynthesis